LKAPTIEPVLPAAKRNAPSGEITMACPLSDCTPGKRPSVQAVPMSVGPTHAPELSAWLRAPVAGSRARIAIAPVS
jgi:hypothetical protein